MRRRSFLGATGAAIVALGSPVATKTIKPTLRVSDLEICAGQTDSGLPIRHDGKGYPTIPGYRFVRYDFNCAYCYYEIDI